jgi:hypothetical protein
VLSEIDSACVPGLREPTKMMAEMTMRPTGDVDKDFVAAMVLEAQVLQLQVWKWQRPLQAQEPRPTVCAATEALGTPMWFLQDSRSPL